MMSIQLQKVLVLNMMNLCTKQDVKSLSNAFDVMFKILNFYRTTQGVQQGIANQMQCSLLLGK